MARIPIYQRQFITLTQATLQPAVGLNGLVQTDIYGNPIAPKITTQPLYINPTEIAGVTEYYDIPTKKYLDLRYIYVGVGLLPIIVTESYANIKTILDNIDCDDLCTDV